MTGWWVVTAFGAGVVSSFGPCVAPRFLVITSVMAGQAGVRRWLHAGIFIFGLCSSYVLLSSAVGTIGRSSAYSTLVYALLGASMTVAGVATVVRTRRCAPRCVPAVQASHGATFMVATVLAAVGSPCCGPLAAAVAGAGLGGAPTAWSYAVPAAFALGHAMPLSVAALGWTGIETLLERWPKAATQTVFGALSMALGSYYALLA